MNDHYTMDSHSRKDILCRCRLVWTVGREHVERERANFMESCDLVCMF